MQGFDAAGGAAMKMLLTARGFSGHGISQRLREPLKVSKHESTASGCSKAKQSKLTPLQSNAIVDFGDWSRPGHN